MWLRVGRGSGAHILVRREGSSIEISAALTEARGEDSPHLGEILRSGYRHQVKDREGAECCGARDTQPSFPCSLAVGSHSPGTLLSASLALAAPQPSHYPSASSPWSFNSQVDNPHPAFKSGGVVSITGNAPSEALVLICTRESQERPTRRSPFSISCVTVLNVVASTRD